MKFLLTILLLFTVLSCEIPTEVQSEVCPTQSDDCEENQGISPGEGEETAIVEEIDDEADDPDQPSPAKTLIGADIYLGGSSKIRHFYLNTTDDSVTDMGEYALPDGGQVAWMEWDEAAGVLFATNNNRPRLELFDYDFSNGQLVHDKALLFKDSANTHFAFHKTSDKYLLFGASYRDSQIDFYSSDLNLEASTLEQTIKFPDNSKTHSNTYDSTRDLYFVAHVELNTVSIFKNIDSRLVEVGTLTVPRPRIVMYDAKYDKIYLSTESLVPDPSFIKVYDIEKSGEDYTLKELSSFSMSSIGSDIKVNHARGYVAALARQPGAETLAIAPLTTEGVIDNSRRSHQIQISLDALYPRSLQITQDGNYYIVSPHSGGSVKDLLIYKMDYDSSDNILSSELIYEVDAMESFQSNFLINRFLEE